MKDIELEQHEYCAEDATYTISGELDFKPNLIELLKRARKLYDKVIDMTGLDTIVVVTDGPTIHIHGNGKVIINSAQNIEEAQEHLKLLFQDIENE